MNSDGEGSPVEIILTHYRKFKLHTTTIASLEHLLF
jgi:hypothetical protein